MNQTFEFKGDFNGQETKQVPIAKSEYTLIISSKLEKIPFLEMTLIIREFTVVAAITSTIIRLHIRNKKGSIIERNERFVFMTTFIFVPLKR